MPTKKKRKVNPRKIPATLADVRKAERQSLEKATEAAIAIIFTSLLDKHGWTQEMLRDLWVDVEKLSEEIAEGRIDIPDLTGVLEDEYQIGIV